MTTLSESRTNQLWATLAGMFGAERLKKAFGAVPPREWIDQCGRLTDGELQRGIRRLIASGSEHIPALPKFRRLCQEVASDDDAPQPTPFPQLPSNLAMQDGWDIRSNLKLCRHLGTRLRKDPRVYGPIVHGHGNSGSAEQQTCTAILVRWKKRWAEAMREAAVDGEVDGTDQREMWEAHMHQAESEIGAHQNGVR